MDYRMKSKWIVSDRMYSSKIILIYGIQFVTNGFSITEVTNTIIY